VMLVMGAFGYLLMKYKYPLSAVVLGMVLGPMAEEYFTQSAEMSNWDFTIFFTRPICIFLWVCILVSLVGSGLLARRNAKRQQAKEIQL